MKYFLSLCFFILISCSGKVKQQNLQYLNGYWDIEKVESTEKKITHFGANTTIDYYFLGKDNTGFRKKTMPDFSGTYKSNNLKDSISITKKDGNFVIFTETSLNNWEDIILELTSEKLVLKNETGTLFYYKKHQKFNFN